MGGATKVEGASGVGGWKRVLTASSQQVLARNNPARQGAVTFSSRTGVTTGAGDASSSQMTGGGAGGGGARRKYRPVLPKSMNYPISMSVKDLKSPSSMTEKYHHARESQGTEVEEDMTSIEPVAGDDNLHQRFIRSPSDMTNVVH